jgi:hypothetical protein
MLLQINSSLKRCKTSNFGLALKWASQPIFFIFSQHLNYYYKSENIRCKRLVVGFWALQQSSAAMGVS